MAGEQYRLRQCQTTNGDDWLLDDRLLDLWASDPDPLEAIQAVACDLRGNMAIFNGLGFVVVSVVPAKLLPV